MQTKLYRLEYRSEQQENSRLRNTNRGAYKSSQYFSVPGVELSGGDIGSSHPIPANDEELKVFFGEYVCEYWGHMPVTKGYVFFFSSLCELHNWFYLINERYEEYKNLLRIGEYCADLDAVVTGTKQCVALDREVSLVAEHDIKYGLESKIYYEESLFTNQHNLSEVAISLEEITEHPSVRPSERIKGYSSAVSVRRRMGRNPQNIARDEVGTKVGARYLHAATRESIFETDNTYSTEREGCSPNTRQTRQDASGTELSPKANT